MIFKEYEKRCVVCGSTFIAHKSNAKTCSGKCRATLNRRKKAMNTINVTGNGINGTNAQNNGNNATNNANSVTNNTISVTNNGIGVTDAPFNMERMRADIASKADWEIDAEEQERIDWAIQQRDPLMEYIMANEVFSSLINIKYKVSYDQIPKLISIDKKDYHYIGNVKERKLGYISDVSFDLADKIAYDKTPQGRYDIYVSANGIRQLSFKHPDFYDKIGVSPFVF